MLLVPLLINKIANFDVSRHINDPYNTYTQVSFAFVSILYLLRIHAAICTPIDRGE